MSSSDITRDAAQAMENVASSKVNRRKLVGYGAGVAAGAALIASSGAGALAQEPNATPAATPTTERRRMGSTRTPESLGDAVPPEFGASTNWPAENRDFSNTRHAVDSGISSETIGQLGDAWRLPIDVAGVYGALTAVPIVVDNTVYLQDMQSNVTALNKETGEVIWRNEYSVPTIGPNGIAAGYGLLAFSLGDTGEMVAVRAEDGSEVWRTSIQGPLDEGITMAPLIYDSTVYVSSVPINSGVGSYLGGQRGVIYALDLNNGNVIWYFDTTTDNLWHNARVNSGGGLWHPPSIDEDGNLYVAIANASPYPGTEDFPAGSSRQGDNDFANAIMRIDPATASYDWFLNVKPFDLFDLDNHLSPILASITIDGAETPVVFTAGKHGFVVAVNRETGEEIWRTAVGKHQNDDLTDTDLMALGEDEYVEVFPGTLGGVETQIAYAEGVLYAPIYNMPTYFNASGADSSRTDFGAATGQLVALDAATGEILWDVAQPTGTLGGALVVNDLVFTGGLDGVARAFSTADGSQVWSYQTASGINAPFAVSGDYLFIPSGGPFLPSEDTWSPAPEPQAELIALKIGGEVQAQPESAGTPAEEGASPAAASDGVEIAAVDIAFEPKELSIAADTPVTVTVTNKGVLQHDFVVIDQDLGTPLLNGGDTATVEINLPAGEYPFHCSVPGHAEAGMVGKLIVG
ncbi:MAG: PQQ-binding-like beta-propeller repeat protein [Thermomicrobiales bacterium]